jgi:hypothetical protein
MRINGAPLTLITRAWLILTSTFFFTFWLLPAFLLRILDFTLHLLFNSTTHNKAGPFIINRVPSPQDLSDQTGRAGIHSESALLPDLPPNGFPQFQQRSFFG